MSLKGEYVIEKQDEFNEKIINEIDVSYHPIGIIVDPIDSDVCSVKLVPSQKERKYQLSTEFVKDELIDENIIQPKTNEV